MLALVLLWALVGAVDSQKCLLASGCSSIGSNAQHYCPAGRYLSSGVDSGWLFVCLACKAGTFHATATYNDIDNTNLAGTCDDCPVGTYMVDLGATQCTTWSGTYPTLSTTAACEANGYDRLFFPNGPKCGVAYSTWYRICQAGRFFQSFPSGAGCNYLNENTQVGYCPEWGGCMVCPPGTYQPKADTENPTCLKCPAGTFSPYLGNHYSLESTAACEQCRPKYFCPHKGLQYPIDCPQGYYSDWGYTACLACTANPADSYISGNGASNAGCAFKCNAGFYKTSTPACAVCGFGRSSTRDLADGSICPPCPYASITGTACATGSYPSFSSTTCAVTKCTACSNLPASGNYYSTTSDQNYYSTAAITTAVSLTI